LCPPSQPPALPAGCTGDCAVAATAVCSASTTNVGKASTPGGSPVAPTSWKSALAPALGKLLADRAEQEVAAWFEDFVGSKLWTLKADGVQWLPHTCKLFEKGTGVGQQFASPILLEAVKQDLPSVLQGMASYVGRHVKNKAVLATVGFSLFTLVAIDF